MNISKSKSQKLTSNIKLINYVQPKTKETHIPIVIDLDNDQIWTKICIFFFILTFRCSSNTLIKAIKTKTKIQILILILSKFGRFLGHLLLGYVSFWFLVVIYEIRLCWNIVQCIPECFGIYYYRIFFLFLKYIIGMFKNFWSFLEYSL